jgi:hypothetical protein
MRSHLRKLNPSRLENQPSNPSFPESLWERPCPRDSFARLGIGDGVASASAFPDGVWERGEKIGVFGWPWAVKDSYEIAPGPYRVIFKGYRTEKVDDREDYYVVRIESLNA